MLKRIRHVLLAVILVITALNYATIESHAEEDTIFFFSEDDFSDLELSDPELSDPEAFDLESSTYTLSEAAPSNHYLSDYDLSDFSNWVSGFFTNSGIHFSSGCIRTSEYLMVDNQVTYSIQLSKDSFSVDIYEYSSDYSFIASYTYNNGAEFTPNKNTSYVGIVLNSSSEKSYSAFSRAFSNSDHISIEPIQDYDDRLTAVDLTNTSLFKKGKYIKKVSSGTSYAKCSNATVAALSLYDSFKLVEPLQEYVFTAPSDDYQLCLVAQDADGAALNELTINNGSVYIPSEKTAGVAVSIINRNSSATVDDIKADLTSGSISISTEAEVTDDPIADDDLIPEDPIDMPAIIPVNAGSAISTTSDAHTFVDSMVAGWNLGNSLDSYSSNTLNGKENLHYETCWGNPKTTPELLEYVADSGFDTIRIPVSWSYHTYKDAKGNYHVYESWLKRVSEIVDMSLDAGLRVIINSHHDHKLFYTGTDTKSFTQVKGNVRSVWGEIAEYFKDYDSRLLFESYNELDNVADGFEYSDLSATQCNELNQLFVDTVRNTGGNNENRLLVIPTLMDKYGAPFMESYVLPSDSADDKLIIEIHMYSKEFDQSLDYSFATLEDYSNRIGAPMIIGEYGYTTNFKTVDQTTAFSNYVARAYQHGIKTIVWDNGVMSTFGIINRNDLSSSRTDIISAIINAAAFEDTDYIDVTEAIVPGIKLVQNTGATVSDAWWGSAVASSSSFEAPLDSSAKYLKVKCINNGDSFSRNIHYVDFYDADGNPIKMNSIGYPGYDFYVYSIPQGAVSVKICLFSSKYKTSKDEYLQYIENGDLRLLIGYMY